MIAACSLLSLHVCVCCGVRSGIAGLRWVVRRTCWVESLCALAWSVCSLPLGSVLLAWPGCSKRTIAIATDIAIHRHIVSASYRAAQLRCRKPSTHPGTELAVFFAVGAFELNVCVPKRDAVDVLGPGLVGALGIPIRLNQTRRPQRL